MKKETNATTNTQAGAVREAYPFKIGDKVRFRRDMPAEVFGEDEAIVTGPVVPDIYDGTPMILLNIGKFPADALEPAPKTITTPKELLKVLENCLKDYCCDKNCPYKDLECTVAIYEDVKTVIETLQDEKQALLRDNKIYHNALKCACEEISCATCPLKNNCPQLSFAGEKEISGCLVVWKVITEYALEGAGKITKRSNYSKAKAAKESEE